MNSIKKINIKIDNKSTNYNGYIMDNKDFYVDLNLIKKLSNVDSEYKNDELLINTDLDWIDIPINELVIIDAGHGGKDSGAVDEIDISKGDNIRTLEKDLNFIISNLVSKKLSVLGISTLLTRDKDEFVSLQDRTDMANRTKAKLFLSIHFNAGNEKARGIETFKYEHSKNPLTIKFAQNLQKSLIDATSFIDRGVKDSSFWVLKNTKMTAALVELGFITNNEEEQILHTEEFQENVSSAIVNAIILTLNDI